MKNINIKIKNTQLTDLWRHLSKRRRKQFFLVLMLMVFTSLTEIISLGAVLPFLGVLTAPEHLFQQPLMQPIIELLNVTTPNQLILPLTMAFIVAVIFAGLIRLLLLYVMMRLSYATGSDLSINIYRRTLYQDYTTHIARNSSELINSIITKTNIVIGGVITPILNFISSIIIAVAIVVLLSIINITVAFSAAIGLGVFYLIIIRYTKKQLLENSSIISGQSTQMVKSLQEGLGGIRDVLINGSQKFYCNLYLKADLPFRRASGNNKFISASPRYAMEAIGIVLITVIAFNMSLNEEGLNTTIPILGSLALGAQRLLPALQLAYGSYTQLKGSHSSLGDILDLLNQPLQQTERCTPVLFKNDIILNNVSFRHMKDGKEKTPWIFENISLKISKGARIGFIGATGSGKSTLLDIIMGLLPPTSGTMTVDGQLVTRKNLGAWQANIAHVPQNIYLSDATIEENIAFGLPKDEINHQQVENAAKQAQIAELINNFEKGYQTLVGERGVRLSGGQRQRIGIARALYNQANVLIFDEATSALDNDTEQSVMNAIEALGKEVTILIIAHRLTTLTGCDEIINLDEKKLKIS
jgi:ATP-binding cassette, subfamily B, bacterial PglK